MACFMEENAALRIEEKYQAPIATSCQVMYGTSHIVVTNRSTCSSLPKIAVARRDGYIQAKRRYGLRVLNYIVTSNHIHLLVMEGEKT